MRNTKDLLGCSEKKLPLNSLASLFVFMCKMLNFYWLCLIASFLRNNEQIKISKTEKQKENFRKISLNEIRRNRINLLITLFNHKEGQKQPPKVFYKKRCSEAGKYIRKKTLGQVFS